MLKEKIDLLVFLSTRSGVKMFLLRDHCHRKGFHNALLFLEPPSLATKVSLWQLVIGTELTHLESGFLQCRLDKNVLKGLAQAYEKRIK